MADLGVAGGVASRGSGGVGGGRPQRGFSLLNSGPSSTTSDAAAGGSGSLRPGQLGAIGGGGSERLGGFGLLETGQGSKGLGSLDGGLGGLAGLGILRSGGGAANASGADAASTEATRARGVGPTFRERVAPKQGDT